MKTKYKAKRERDFSKLLVGADDNDFSRRWPNLYFKPITIRDMVLLGITLKPMGQEPLAQGGVRTLTFTIKDYGLLYHAEEMLSDDPKAFAAMMALRASSGG